MKIKITFLVFIFLMSNFAHGQVKFRVKKLNADSLVALIPEKKGTERIDVINLLSNVICRQNIDSSIMLASQAIDLSEKLEYQKGLADGYFNVGNVYFLRDSLKPTISNYLKALRIYEELEPSEEYGNLCIQLGLINRFWGRYEVSFQYFEQAQGIYNIIIDKAGQAMAYHAMGVLKYVFYNELDSATYYCEKALPFLDPTLYPTEVAYIYREIGNIYRRKFFENKNSSFLHEALSWHFKALDLPEIEEEAKAFVYLNLGTAYLNFNTDASIQTAIKYYQNVNSIADSCFDAYDLKSHTYEMLGWTYYMLGNYDMAIFNFRQGIKLIEERLSDFSINDFKEPVLAYNSKYYHKVNKQSIFEGLYYTYFKLGDYKKALHYFELSTEAEKDIYKEKTQNLITMLESISEEEKTEKQIAILARDNEMNKMKVAQSRTYVIVMGGFVIIIVLLTMLFIRQRKTRVIVREQKLLHDLELKNMESEKLKELDHLKSRFFANISHEFRTPLTLILSPAEKLLNSITNENHRNDLLIIHRYARRLRRLINQLLNLSKLEAGKLKLNAKKENIIKLIRRFTQSFESLAKQRQIALIFSAESEEIIASVDRNKLEIIINNLLSNAFKFTPENGRIEVIVRNVTDGKNSINGVQVIVSDSGIGIPEEKLDKIFERFYMADDTNSRQHEGTGIGLALTKELIKLHNGEISVESKINKGTEFTIVLPIDNPDQPMDDTEIPDQMDIFENMETSAAEPVDTGLVYQKPEMKVKSGEPEEKASNPLLLIVEDNPDLRAHISFHLSDDYRIMEARDGEEGFAEAVENIPDLIISDVMMPKMDGHILCKKLKADERTSHIPVILLTARASKESRIEGLETGADDFITKPFEIDELLVRVKNLIEQRRRLSKVLEKKIQKSNNSVIVDFEDIGLTSMDEQFLQKTFSVLKERYADPEFNVEVFCHEVGLSRIQLHRKVKALTRQTTGEFIRSYRLNRAAGMLKKQSATIAEIAYDVGFSSPSYFSECFRKQFGKLPTEFTKNT